MFIAADTQYWDSLVICYTQRKSLALRHWAPVEPVYRFYHLPSFPFRSLSPLTPSFLLSFHSPTHLPNAQFFHSISFLPQDTTSFSLRSTTISISSSSYAYVVPHPPLSSLHLPPYLSLSRIHMQHTFTYTPIQLRCTVHTCRSSTYNTPGSSIRDLSLFDIEFVNDITENYSGGVTQKDDQDWSESFTVQRGIKGTSYSIWVDESRIPCSPSLRYIQPLQLIVVSMYAVTALWVYLYTYHSHIQRRCFVKIQCREYKIRHAYM